ncbi:hypothetical protein Ddc_00814 [Ditylenchus destructor]|nr:hypothetical protein Ddc_00814 [Ditylenchus destructor]
MQKFPAISLSNIPTSVYPPSNGYQVSSMFGTSSSQYPNHTSDYWNSLLSQKQFTDYKPVSVYVRPISMQNTAHLHFINNNG